MKIYSLDEKRRLPKEDAQEVAQILKKGGVVVVPTDTSYGMAALIRSKKGVEKVFSLKGRNERKTSSIVVRSKAQALEYGRISCKPTKLWKAFLPGPLTLVVQSKRQPIKHIVRDDNTVAIRRIETPVVNQLLKLLPAPITITSANRSEKNDIYSLKQFSAQYKGHPKPDAFIDAGVLPKRIPSTVVAAFDTLQVFRVGPISAKQIEKILNG